MKIRIEQLFEKSVCREVARLLQGEGKFYLDGPMRDLPLIGEAIKIGKGWAESDLGREVICETALLAALQIGETHEAHADNCRLTSGGEWEPNHTPRRVWTCILYLNDELGGGELVFPDRGLQVSPKAGRMVGFAAGQEYWHGVRAVRSGVRYSLAVWYAYPY